MDHCESPTSACFQGSSLVQVLKDFLHFFSAENIEMILRTWGWHSYWLVSAIVFAETGLLIGFFLPGDSLLFITGFVASTGAINLFVCWVLLCAMAIIGDAVGYQLGRLTGDTVWSWEDSIWFKRSYLTRTHDFYERYGKKTIIYARFVPIVRTFAPFMAGVAKMPYRDFALYNIVGGIGWVISLTTLGYFLGQVPFLKKHIDLAVIAVIVISMAPIFVEFARHKLAAARAAKAGGAGPVADLEG